ncbi:uncharacterized protein TNCV_4858851 [Trichonephila clavipes]|nr:uncharacterized protein TNCV_4858851 [Trichonephila clavipes]
MLSGTPGLRRTQFEDLSRGHIGALRKSTGEKTRIQNPKLNIVECIEGLDNRKKYLVSQRSDDNLRISVDSVTTLATDLGTGPEFPISKFRKKVYLFVYEDIQIPSSNSRSLQQIDDLPYYLSANRYSGFCV